MLVELAVRDLGVIAEARIPLSAGMTVLTGETGAGKTMVVEALRLLSGAKADPSRVREGAREAVVEALFEVGDTEWVVRRVVPAVGRSRGYLNGELVTAGQLSDLARELLEIHGQHSQQTLLDRRHQRDALDRYAGADTTPLTEARARRGALRSELESLGGDERARRRQLDLLAHQVSEIESVAPSAGEEDALAAEEDRLAGAVSYREAAAEALELLSGESTASDLLARAVAVLGGEGPFAQTSERLRGLVVELGDAVSDLRSEAESIEPDEERLAAVRQRRQGLVDLRRKYGETLEDVLDFLDNARAELDSLAKLDERRSAVSQELERADSEGARAAAELGALRRAAAPRLAAAVRGHLAGLALASCVVEVDVGDTPETPGAGEAVEIRISTNPGMTAAPLSKVASGGELSRVMLALRLVLSGGPPTMVFDEVDAGVGGAAAVSVGSALGALAGEHQVIVVTHLAQVAAFADVQVLVHKDSGAAGTVTTTTVLSGPERVVELSRMLSGSPGSDAARRHAEELLADAASARATGASRSPVTSSPER